MSGQAGVVTAVVATEPDGLGRVGVRYPWLPGGDALEPRYAPVAAALAGGGAGAWLMPEKGDEVLVAFRHGEWDHPYVVGFLWNGGRTPPESDRSNRVIKTPGGHTLRFEDGGAKKVILRTAGGHELELDDGGTVTLSHSGGAGKLEMTASAVTVTGGGRSVKLEAGQVQIN